MYIDTKYKLKEQLESLNEKIDAVLLGNEDSILLKDRPIEEIRMLSIDEKKREISVILTE